MTSNVGAEIIKRETSLGFKLKTDDEMDERMSYRDMEKKLTGALKRTFRPEFINRVDSTIIFRSLNRDGLHKIVSIELEKVSKRLIEHEIDLTATPAALDMLADQGFDSEMGARPLRRVIQQKVEDPLSDGLLSGRFEHGAPITVDVGTVSSEDEDDREDIVLKAEELDVAEEPEMEPVA
jgi:ATP-dependent Clp protease ATP-binding subunit ClpC